jgi:hypothetical protein
MSNAIQYYGAVRWKLVVIPNPARPPGATGYLNLKLMNDREALTFGSAGGTFGGTFVAGPQQRSYGAYDAYMKAEVTAVNYACGAGTHCDHAGGGRYLMDIWWAYSDTPIDPALLSPAPEPQTWAMLLAGLFGIARAARRQRQLLLQ